MTTNTDCPDTPPEMYIYMDTLAWIAGFVKRQALDGEHSEEEMQAQVGADLRKLLDENWKAH